MRMTLKNKISWVYTGLVCLIALVGMVSLFNLMTLHQAVGGLLHENYDSISAMTTVRKAVAQQSTSLLQYLELNDSAAITRFHTMDSAALQAIWKEKGNVTEPGEKTLSNALADHYMTWQQDFSVFQNTRDTKGLVEAEAYYKTVLQPLASTMDGEIDRIISTNQIAMFQKQNAATLHTRNSLVIVLLFSVLAVAGGFFLSRYLLGRFLRPLRTLTDSIGQIRVGQTYTPVDIHTGDEMEQLAHEFNGMMERLSAFEKSTLGTLMEEKNRSVAIVKSIADPLLVLDSTFKILMANSACEQFFDFTESRVLGRHFLEVMRDSELFHFILDSTQTGNAVAQKIWHCSREKDYYFNLILTHPQNNGTNRRGSILLMQNVTAFKELEVIKTNFVATISHEFKTPLTSIIMGASMLQGGHIGELNPEQAEIVHTIMEDGEKLSSFVGELLEVSRLESGKAVYSFEPCAFSAIVEKSLPQFMPLAAQKQVSIENEVEESLPLVYADFERITWVINNLIGNALKYTKAGDFITIRAQADKTQMEISVQDTGDGIPAAYIDRIFDKFVQVKGQDVEVRGTGLGLAVAKEIVTAHQGTIWAKSEPDAGSTFTFTLPLFDSSGEAKGK